LSPAAGMDALSQRIPALHAWYRANARDLPWRRRGDAYAVWVSEIMLQQTRVTAAIPYYERWMLALPTLRALARADDHTVLRLWEGLGYYSRARNLLRAARIVVERHGGRIPDDPREFQALPGVGPYTAAAVMSIAFGRDLAVVDGNVRRVLARLTALPEDPRSGEGRRRIDRLARDLLPPGRAGVHNQALMELGALVCPPRSPSCAACPLREPCLGRATPEAYPVRRPRKRRPHHRVAVGIVRRPDGRVLIDRRPYGGLLGGLWEFPGGKIEPGETPARAAVRELREELGVRAEPVAELPPVEHAYSHFTVTLHPLLCRFVEMDPAAGEGREWRWVPPGELPHHPMPRANRKILELLTHRWKEEPPCPTPSPGS